MINEMGAGFIDMFDPSTTRELYLGQEVTNDSVITIIKKIDAINEWYNRENNILLSVISQCRITSDSDISIELPVVEPINLNIISYGGSIYDGLALINTIENSSVPVNTTVTGHAMSMGLIISCAGEKRYGFNKSTWMYHEGSSWNIGFFTDQEEQLRECKRIQSIIDGIVVKNSEIDQDYLDEVKESKKNWYINGEQALKLGLIDELIDSDIIEDMLVEEDRDYVDIDGVEHEVIEEE